MVTDFLGWETPGGQIEPLTPLLTSRSYNNSGEYAAVTGPDTLV